MHVDKEAINKIVIKYRIEFILRYDYHALQLFNT